MNLDIELSDNLDNLQSLEENVISQTFEKIFGVKYKQILGSPYGLSDQKEALQNLKTIKDNVGVDCIKSIVLEGKITIGNDKYTINPSIDILAFIRELAQLSTDQKLTFDELQIFEQDLTLISTQKDIQGLQKEVKESLNASNQISTYNVIQGTKFEREIQTQIKNPETVQSFCDKIDDIWYQYMQTFHTHLDEIVMHNMATGMSFYMLQWLNTQNTTQQNNFWESLGSWTTGQESNIQSLQSFVGQAFSMLNTGSGALTIFQQLSSLQKVITHAHLDPQSSLVSPLANPAQFVTLMNSIPTQLDDQQLAGRCQAINSQNPKDTGYHHLTDKEKQGLQSIVNQINFDQTTYQGLMKFQSIATDFVTKQPEYKHMAIDGIEAILGDQSVMSQITQSLKEFGIIDNVVGVDRLASPEVKESSIGKILHVIFFLLGYADGIDGFLSEYYIKKMNLTESQKETIANIYNIYKTKSKDTLEQNNNDNRQNIWSSLLGVVPTTSNNVLNTVSSLLGLPDTTSTIRSTDEALNNFYVQNISSFRFDLLLDSMTDALHTWSAESTPTIANCPVNLPHIYSILSHQADLMAMRDTIFDVQKVKNEDGDTTIEYSLKSGGATLLQELFANTHDNMSQTFLTLYGQDLMKQLHDYEHNNTVNKLLQTHDAQNNLLTTPTFDTDKMIFLASTYMAKGPVGIQAIRQGVRKIENLPNQTSDHQEKTTNEETQKTTTNEETQKTTTNEENQEKTTNEETQKTTTNEENQEKTTNEEKVNTQAPQTITAKAVGAPKTQIKNKKNQPTIVMAKAVSEKDIMNTKTSKEDNIFPVTFGELLNQPSGIPYQRYQSDIENVCKETGVPSNILLQLLIKEGSRGNPHRLSGGATTNNIKNKSCVGLGQMGKAAWVDMMEKYNNDPPLSKRFDPYAQILQAARLLKYIKEEKKSNNRFRVIAYYNSGLNVTNAHIPKRKKSNPQIAQYMKTNDNTVAGYLDAAEKYYSQVG